MPLGIQDKMDNNGTCKINLYTILVNIRLFIRALIQRIYFSYYLLRNKICLQILFYLETYLTTGEDSYIKQAEAGADYLLSLIPDLQSQFGDAGLYTGLSWPMSPDYPRLMPNFSHGTAGTAYFLSRLYEVAKN